MVNNLLVFRSTETEGSSWYGIHNAMMSLMLRSTVQITNGQCGVKPNIFKIFIVSSATVIVLHLDRFRLEEGIVKQSLLIIIVDCRLALDSVIHDICPWSEVKEFLNHFLVILHEIFTLVVHVPKFIILEIHQRTLVVKRVLDGVSVEMGAEVWVAVISEVIPFGVEEGRTGVYLQVEGSHGHGIVRNYIDDWVGVCHDILVHFLLLLLDVVLGVGLNNLVGRSISEGLLIIHRCLDFWKVHHGNFKGSRRERIGGETVQKGLVLMVELHEVQLMHIEVHV